MNNQSNNVKECSEYHCPGCGSTDLEIFYEAIGVPIHGTSIMLTRNEAVKCPKGDVILGLCSRCGFITNTAYNPSLIREVTLYEDQQGFSQTFKVYINNLAQHLIRKYNLYNKNIVEIGCGKGDFLKILCEIGHNTGIGIDPLSSANRSEREASESLTFIQEYFSKEHEKHISDFVCCRHTLEHIQLPLDLLRMIRNAIGENSETIIFFEVPDVTRILVDIAFWDIYYEHCSYFSPGSLGQMFRKCGLEIIDLTTAYDDQYILIEGRLNSTSHKEKFQLEYEVEELPYIIKSFADGFYKMLSIWTARIHYFHNKGQRIVIWGSGSKCVAFISTLGILDEVKYIVDINPHRHGKFVPGSGKEIKSPLFLQEYKPNLVIVMNPIYIREIKQMLSDMAIVTEVVTV